MRFSALSLAQHYVLASLVKGRWIDGKAQTVALLRFNCDTPAFSIYQTFLPSRRRDCHIESLHSHSLCKIATAPRPAPTLQNRTIPLTFRTAIVCVCLYGFAFELSLSLFVGERACSSRCTEPFRPHNHCKRTTYPSLSTTSLPCLPLPLHQPSPSPQPLQKDNIPSPRTTFLPCLPLPLHRPLPAPSHSPYDRFLSPSRATLSLLPLV